MPSLAFPLTAPCSDVAQQLPSVLQRKLRPLAARGRLGGGGGALAGLSMPADTPTLHALLRTSRDEGLRRAAFEACHRQPTSNLAVLDALVEVRGGWRVEGGVHYVLLFGGLV